MFFHQTEPLFLRRKVMKTSANHRVKQTERLLLPPFKPFWAEIRKTS